MKKEFSRWTEQEKEALTRVMQQNKEDGIRMSWKEIAMQTGGKTARQCYDEWVILKKAQEV